MSKIILTLSVAITLLFVVCIVSADTVITNPGFEACEQSTLTPWFTTGGGGGQANCSAGGYAGNWKIWFASNGSTDFRMCQNLSLYPGTLNVGYLGYGYGNYWVTGQTSLYAEGGGGSILSSFQNGFGGGGGVHSGQLTIPSAGNFAVCWSWASGTTSSYYMDEVTIGGSATLTPPTPPATLPTVPEIVDVVGNFIRSFAVIFALAGLVGTMIYLSIRFIRSGR